MANKIKPKRSYTANSVPLTTDLEVNELAINWADGKAYTKNASGQIVSVTLGGSGGGGGGSSSLVTAATVAGFPATGSTANIYIATDTNRIYRWDSTNSVYVELGPLVGSGSNWTKVAVPASATATGSEGQYAYGGGYFYVATGTNQWERAALATWTNFSPLSVTGLQLWLDASDASSLYDATSGGSLVAADGGVARWEDKSGNARHATQGTSGSRPLRKATVQNGKDALRFDGSDDFLTSADFLDLSSGQSITAFAVVNRAATGAYHAILSKFDRTGGAATEDGWSFRFTDTNKCDAVFFKDASGTTVLSDNTVSGSSFLLLAFKTTAGSFTASTVLYANGSEIASSSTGTVQQLDDTGYPLQIGIEPYSGAFYSAFSGDIAEIVIYSSALSDTDRAAVETYLMQKWAIA